RSAAACPAGSGHWRPGQCKEHRLQRAHTRLCRHLCTGLVFLFFQRRHAARHVVDPHGAPGRAAAGKEAPGMTITFRRQALGLLLAIFGLMIFGVLADPYQLRLATEILLIGTAVMSLNLVTGQGGLVSLCHGALFGGAAYAAALLAQHIGASLPLVLLAGVVTCTVLAC